VGLPSFSFAPQLAFSCTWNPRSPAGRPLSAGVKVTPPPEAAETVMVPIDLPTPLASIDFMSTL
jgi:hypothetical protein